MSFNDVLKNFNFAKNVLQVSKKAFGAGITWTNNEIKDIVKVIKSLENREILLKETTTKSSSQERGFLDFLTLLMADALPLMKSVLTTWKLFVTIRITSRNVSSSWSYLKENLWIRHNSLNNFKRRNGI